MKHLLGIIGVVLSFGAFAQAPGYLGQRIEVGIHLDGLNNPNEMQKEDVGLINADRGLFNPTLSPGIHAGMSLSKRFSAFVSFNTHNMYTYDEVGILSGEIAGGGNVQLYSWIKSRATSFQIGVKSFLKNKGAIAPIGSYFSWSLNRLSTRFTELEYEAINEISQQPARINVNFKDRYELIELENRSSWALGMGLGNSWIVAQDKIKVDCQIMFHLHLPQAEMGGSRKSYFGDDYYETAVGSVSQVDDRISWQPLRSLRRATITQMRLGISYLL